MPYPTVNSRVLHAAALGRFNMPCPYGSAAFDLALAAIDPKLAAIVPKYSANLNPKPKTTQTLILKPPDPNY